MTDVLLCIAYGAHWLLILAWSACHLQITEARRRICRSIPRADDRGIGPSVTVILPAKDEAGELEPAAMAILAQRGVTMDFVIVDDRSADATADIADRIAARDRRCRVFHNRELPAGWMGKSHACHLGADGAATDWLLFTDADVRLAPEAVASAIAYAERERLDLLSFWPRDDSAGFWPRLLVPLCGAMIVIWYGAVAARSNARGDAFANGQFLVIRRSAYVIAGGHAAIREFLIEDIPLARAVAGRGMTVGSAPAPELASVRMYRTLGEVVRGWRRIYAGVLSPLQIVGCVVSLILGSLLPMLLPPVMLVIALYGSAGEWPLLWLTSAAAQLVVLMSVSVRFFGLARCDRRYLWLYPLSVVGVLLILMVALRDVMLQTSVEWRGTRYSIQAKTIRCASMQRVAHGEAIPLTTEARSGTTL